jgi:hypothetical protein
MLLVLVAILAILSGQGSLMGLERFATRCGEMRAAHGFLVHHGRPGRPLP